MALIHHVVRGHGQPPIVFVHGFGCSLSDWDGQVAQLCGRYRTVAVDLRGHGASPGVAEDCSVERYGADVVAVMRDLALSPAVLVGHSMGCRVVTEAVRQAPALAAGVVLVDGSQFSASMAATLAERFAEPDGYAAFRDGTFREMFTAGSAAPVVTSVLERARQLPRAIGERMLCDMQRYDVERFSQVLSELVVPMMVVQATFSNERRQRRSLQAGQTTPYLDMVRAHVPSVRIEIIPNAGHFPQLEDVGLVNGLIEAFVGGLAG